jgi:MFS family permease
VADDATLDRTKSLPFKELRHVRGIDMLAIASVLGCLTQYANYATTFSFVPIYAVDIGASKAALGWLSVVVFLPHTLGALMSGRLSERLGERALVVGGLTIMGLTSVAIPFIQDVTLLIISRMLYGMGTGVSFPVLMGLSIKQIDREQRASAMGVFQAVYAMGMFAGPAVSGVVAEGWGIPGMFYSVGALCGIAALFAGRFIPGEP